MALCINKWNHLGSGPRAFRLSCQSIFLSHRADKLIASSTLMQLPVGFSDQLEVGYFSLIHPLAIFGQLYRGHSCCRSPSPASFFLFSRSPGRQLHGWRSSYRSSSSTSSIYTFSRARKAVERMIAYGGSSCCRWAFPTH